MRLRVALRRSSPLRALALALLACLAAATGATAARAADLTGTWDLPSGSVAQQQWTFTSGTGTLAGEGSGGPYTWPMAGTLSGDAVQITTAYRGSSYTAYFVGTVAADGATMSGTWDTGSYAAAQASAKTWIARRRGGPPSPPDPGPGPTDPTPTDPGRHATGTQVMCNRGPNPGDDSVCTATVGDGDAAPTQPTGEVAFATRDGGTFRTGDRCVLQPTASSPTVASCAVRYVPPAGGGFPDVVAAYQGDPTHAPSVGTTRLLSAAIFGLADGTPITPDTCAATAGAATRASGRAAAPRLQQSNPLRNPVAGVGDYVAFCASNLAHQAWGGLVRTGQAVGTVAGGALSVGGVVVAIADPEPVGKAVGVTAVGAGPVVAYGSIRVGESLIEANDRALADPPDPRYRTVVRVAKPRAIVVRRGGAAGRRLATLAARQARVAALARAFGQAIDKAGGAKQANQRVYVGRQTRAAIAFAGQLAAELGRLERATTRAASALRKVRGATSRVSAARIASGRARLAKRVPTRLSRFLRKAGWSAADVGLLRRAARRTASAGAAPASAAAVITDPTTLRLYRQTALAMRYFSVVPAVRADAALR